MKTKEKTIQIRRARADKMMRVYYAPVSLKNFEVYIGIQNLEMFK